MLDIEKEDIYTEENIIQLIQNPIINQYSKIDYGKVIATINEHYVKLNINNFIGQKILLHNESDYLELKEKYNINSSNNGPGFDLFHIKTLKKIQVKFRQVDGKTPYSKQLHFENTRRHSEKNNNESAKSGHIAYSINEFDFIIITLCHIQNNKRPNYKNWSFSLIPIKELEDPNNLGYCLSHIPSSVVEKYHKKNIEELCEAFK